MNESSHPYRPKQPKVVEPVELDDCCLRVKIQGFPRFVFDFGQTDIFTGEEVIWPGPVIYWSNGVISEGGIDFDDAMRLMKEGLELETDALRQKERMAAAMEARRQAGLQ